MDFQTLNFIGALALHQHRRDCAIGLTHVTGRARGLLWFYNVKQRELFIEASRKALVYGAIQKAKSRIEEIMSEIHNAKSHDEAMALLIEAQRLQIVTKDLTNA